MPGKNTRKSHGFSLLEMMLVVVIIGLIAAIAIPRMSRGAAGAGDSALTGSLWVLRDALDRYAAEHGGAYPTVANFNAAITTYTDASGATSATRDTTHIYGPYIRQVPPLPVGAAKGNTGVAAAAGTGIGWIYDATNGNISANTTTEADATGKLYNTY
ncbi:MAG: type II secretion system protein [Phycisphaerae bacterium]